VFLIIQTPGYIFRKLMQKKFCCLPWVEGYTNTVGTYGICCQENSNFNLKKIPINESLQNHWNGEHIRSTRLKFINGEALPQCQVCWTDEDNGKISMRHRRNHRYLDSPDPGFDDPGVVQLINATDKDGYFTHAPRAFNFSVGTICQLRCIECSPSYSRSILKDYHKLGWSDSFKTRKDPETFNIMLDQKKLDQHLWPMLESIADTVEWLQITGGEPTLSRPLSTFLDWCVERDIAKNISVLICTNAVNIKPEFIDIMGKFKLCIFSFSVDGYGNLDEYIRYPTNWDKKEKIIRDMMPMFPHSGICMAVGSLNINLFDRMVDWALDNNYLLNPQIITVPDNLSFRHLPNDLKNHARDLLHSIKHKLSDKEIQADKTNFFDKIGYLSDGINGMLKYLDEPADLDAWKETIEIVRAYDTIRPVPLHKINPWFLGHTD